jgi:hypothetical protein
MAKIDTINLTKCPYCGEEWVREDTELVCRDCEPRLSVDLALADLVNAVDSLKNSGSDQIEDRADLLISTHQVLGEIIKKIKPRT